MHTRTLTLRVDRIRRLTAEVLSFDLVHPAGLALPAYRPGAHLDLHTPGGFMRQYSLAEAPPASGAPLRYRIGVKREPAGRGGSAALHDRVREGDLLAVGAPRSHFGLAGGAGPHLLLAGGIGLTPLLAMAQQLSRERHAFRLCVFARSPAHLPFRDELEALAPHVALHLDEGGPTLSLDRLLADPAPGSQLYLCGPAGFMAAARRAAAAWDPACIHVEHFAPPDDDAATGQGEPFELHLLQRGIRVPVAAGQSAVEALHDLGIVVPTSCEQGLCGTCVVEWVQEPGGAAPDHRDHCLSGAERAGKVALCRSRGKGVLAIRL
jgi:vanillate O-demethylase ferredoxin subunit